MKSYLKTWKKMMMKKKNLRRNKSFLNRSKKIRPHYMRMRMMTCCRHC
jgi:hypothetical protein